MSHQFHSSPFMSSSPFISNIKYDIYNPFTSDREKMSFSNFNNEAPLNRDLLKDSYKDLNSLSMSGSYRQLSQEASLLRKMERFNQEKISALGIKYEDLNSSGRQKWNSASTRNRLENNPFVRGSTKQMKVMRERHLEERGDFIVSSIKQREKIDAQYHQQTRIEALLSDPQIANTVSEQNLKDYQRLKAMEKQINEYELGHKSQLLGAIREHQVRGLPKQSGFQDRVVFSFGEEDFRNAQNQNIHSNYNNFKSPPSSEGPQLRVESTISERSRGLAVVGREIPPKPEMNKQELKAEKAQSKAYVKNNRIADKRKVKSASKAITYRGKVFQSIPLS